MFIKYMVNWTCYHVFIKETCHDNIKRKTYLFRALEPEDLEFIHDIENDETIWELSNTITPYSKYLIKAIFRTCSQRYF